MERIKELWQNDYFKTLISISAIIVLFIVFWYGSMSYFGNSTPYLVVSSGSMRPTLEVGDLIVVKRIDPSQLHGDPMNGDVIVYKSFSKELVVHRLISIIPTDGGYSLTTQGDANQVADAPFSDDRYVGKVVARIPFIGHISLFTHTTQGFYFFVFLIFIFIILYVIIPSGEEKQENSSNEKNKRKKGLVSFVTLLIVNVLIIAFIIFSLWGNFSFWQPGAERGFQHVTIRGMYADLQYHKNFDFENVKDAILNVGLFTYTINCEMADGGIRTGVPTFSWAQFSILILIVVNAWIIYNSPQLRKMLSLNMRH